VKTISLKTTQRILTNTLAAILLISGGYWMGMRNVQKNGVVRSVSSAKQVVNKDGKENVDFAMFWEVWNRLEASYLDKEAIDTKKMVYGAIQGMTASLGDPYTSFLPPADNQQTNEDLQGEFDGVGIQLGYINKTLAVMSALADHPAIKAGVKSGDLILKIKDEKKGVDVDTNGMSLPDAVQKIRGKKGEPVKLTVFTEGDKSEREVTLIRDTIKVPSVELSFVNEKGEKNDNGEFAHLQVIRFGEKTDEEWNDAVRKILAQKNFKGVILDLRNNPGGYLQRAIDLASEFIEDGVVVKQQGVNETETFSVNRKGRLIDKPLVVLINKGSASASEILAGALRDRLSVKLIGENSFGKGTVQEAQNLTGGAGLHVTIARWLLPNGANIHHEGLKPDIEVKNEVDEKTGEVNDLQLKKAIEEI
jgi:carboxyl-terminal processing protease